MAPVRLKALPPFAGVLTGVAAGTIVAILLPGTLGSALGLVFTGAGVALSLRALESRAAAQREQLLAGLGEVKVRLATNAIRIDSLSQRVEQMPMRDVDAAPARAAINELTAEVGLLGDLIHQVATTLADHDEKLARTAVQPAPPAVPAAAPEVVIDPEAARRERAERLAAEREAAAKAAEAEAEAERAEIIGAALSEGRLEVHLQPMVSLPQRRTQGYEALPRLRLDENTLLMPHEFMRTVEERGFGPTLDALVLTRALAIARHLGAKDGKIFVSCNFSASTWESARALATLARILDKYRDHAGQLVVEVPQAIFRALHPTSLGLLGAMSANRVRFALDQVADLRFDPQALYDRGIRFVKIPASLLRSYDEGRLQSDIAVGDLAALLGRASVALVADEVEDNPTAADMIELGIGLGQGLAFSPPRPVKPEVFAEPEEAQQSPQSKPPGAPAEPARSAEIVGYPAPPAPAAAAEPARPERVPFRSVLRRATG
ncbi:cyclic-di-GMP phosphodiesterase, flagellum assembly factor TipF [Bosea sp. TND4EK4]|nr:cyclic-di-GMP phosphodiesterase, flagellum assembly factor TipF [Bosea sp. TND4EK4]